MINASVRLKAKSKGVPLWALADELGISEPTLYRRLRRELSPEQRKQFLDAIDKIARKHK